MYLCTHTEKVVYFVHSIGVNPNLHHKSIEKTPTFTLRDVVCTPCWCNLNTSKCVTPEVVWAPREMGECGILVPKVVLIARFYCINKKQVWFSLGSGHFQVVSLSE